MLLNLSNFIFFIRNNLKIPFVTWGYCKDQMRPHMPRENKLSINDHAVIIKISSIHN